MSSSLTVANTLELLDRPALAEGEFDAELFRLDLELALLPAIDAPEPMRMGCGPDCVFEYSCDSNGTLWSQECCYLPSCQVSCSQFINVGNC